MKQQFTYTRLRPGDEPTLRSWCAAHVLGTELFTALALEPDGTDGRIWVARSGDGAPAAAVYCCTSYSVYLSPERAGVGRNTAGAPLLLGMPRRRDRYVVMEKRGATASVPAPAVRQAEGEKLRALFAMMGMGWGILSRQMQELNYIYQQRCANRGLAAAFGAYENGAPVSCAMICAENERFALIGNVFTRPEFRGRGYASAVLAACEAFAAEQGRTPVLYCKKQTAAFYRGRGYKKVKTR